MLASIKNIHFIGIGGIGMSGIAELLHNQDFNITGSDLSKSSNVERLEKLGIQKILINTFYLKEQFSQFLHKKNCRHN